MTRIQDLFDKHPELKQRVRLNKQIVETNSPDIVIQQQIRHAMNLSACIIHIGEKFLGEQMILEDFAIEAAKEGCIRTTQQVASSMQQLVDRGAMLKHEFTAEEKSSLVLPKRTTYWYEFNERGDTSHRPATRTFISENFSKAEIVA